MLTAQPDVRLNSAVPNKKALKKRPVEEIVKAEPVAKAPYSGYGTSGTTVSSTLDTSFDSSKHRAGYNDLEVDVSDESTSEEDSRRRAKAHHQQRKAAPPPASADKFSETLRKVNKGDNKDISEALRQATNALSSMLGGADKKAAASIPNMNSDTYRQATEVFSKMFGNAAKNPSADSFNLTPEALRQATEAVSSMFGNAAKKPSTEGAAASSGANPDAFRQATEIFSKVFNRDGKNGNETGSAPDLTKLLEGLDMKKIGDALGSNKMDMGQLLQSDALKNLDLGKILSGLGTAGKKPEGSAGNFDYDSLLQSLRGGAGKKPAGNPDKFDYSSLIQNLMGAADKPQQAKKTGAAAEKPDYRKYFDDFDFTDDDLFYREEV